MWERGTVKTAEVLVCRESLAGPTLFKNYYSNGISSGVLYKILRHFLAQTDPCQAHNVMDPVILHFTDEDVVGWPWLGARLPPEPLPLCSWTGERKYNKWFELRTEVALSLEVILLHRKVR